MRLTASLLILLALMSACGPVKINDCPPLSPVPGAALDVLQSAHDTTVDAWVVDLDRHYQKLDACNE